MDDEIYVRDFIKGLPHGQLGQFEPVSGLVQIDFTSPQMDDFISHYGGPSTELHQQIARTINHEIFHFAQTVASGYMYRRQHAMFEIFRSTKTPSALPVPETAEGERLTDLQQRAVNTVTLVNQMDRTSRLRDSAPPGDNTLAGAVNPELFEHLRGVDEAERQESRSGLSINALIEGSAAVHAEILLDIDEHDPRAHVMPALSGQPARYTTLYDLTAQRFGDDTLSVLLPATALALRYSQPHEAYFVIAEELCRRREVDPVTAGRELLRAGLPRITRAGRQLGTASDLHVPTEQFSVYDRILSELAAGDWGMDEYTLLADPRAMHLMSKWPVGVILSDGGWMGDIPPVTLAVRLIIMSAFLRVRSRIREERAFEKNAIQWLRSSVGAPADE